MASHEEDLAEVDPVVESMELVRAHLEGEFEQQWDYRGEDPHHDQRGFRVSGLQQDKEEEEFVRQDAYRSLSFYEMKSDLVLRNGARFYNDHTHPEYSTPECRTLQDLVAHDRAGERIVQQAADKRNRQIGSPAVQLYKNNTDFHGHSYGCHDNYLVSRIIPFSDLQAALIPFFSQSSGDSWRGKSWNREAGAGSSTWRVSTVTACRLYGSVTWGRYNVQSTDSQYS